MASSTHGAPRPGASSVRPSLTQVTASALAAVSAAVVSSTFGVAGTLIGAAIASVIASVGSTLYLASLRSTNDRLRRLAAARRPDGTIAPEVLESEVRLEEAQRRSLWWTRLRWSRLRSGLPSLRRRWLAVGVLTIAVFGIAVGLLTAVEASTNQPVSALLGGGNRSGTSLGQVLDPKATTTRPTPPTPTPTSTPTSAPTPGTGTSPSPSPSSQPTPSATPTAGVPTDPSPSVSAGEPAPSPSATVSTAVPASPEPTPATAP